MDDEDWEAKRRAVLAYRAGVGFTATLRPRAPGGFTHGTRYAYQKRQCRCDPCRQWLRDDKRRRRERAA